MAFSFNDGEIPKKNNKNKKTRNFNLINDKKNRYVMKIFPRKAFSLLYRNRIPYSMKVQKFYTRYNL